MIEAELNNPAALNVTLADGATGKGIRALVRTIGGSPITTVTLNHIGDGTYANTFTPTTLGFLSVTFIVFTDTTFNQEDVLYARTSEVYKVIKPTSPEIIADAVWDETLTNHLNAGSTGKALNDILQGTSPSSLASAVWDEDVSNHQTANTFGNYVQVIRQFVIDNNDELTDPSWGLDKLLGEIQTNRGDLTTEINENETKIDNLSSQLSSAKSDIQSDIQTNKNKIDSLFPHIDNAESNIIVEINENENKLDSISSAVQSVQNNTTEKFIVPPRLIKPSSGSKDYEFHLRLYDSEGNPEAPDSTPTISIKRVDNGNVLISSDSMSQVGSQTGAYFYTYSVGSGANEAPLLVEASVTEGGVTKTVPATTEVTEFESDLNAIQNSINTVDTKVTDTQSKVNDSGFGLQAIRNKQDDIVNEIDGNEAILNAIKSQTDLLPSDPASESNVDDVETAVLSRPSLSEIQNRLDNLRSSIKGTDTRDITEVYDLVNGLNFLSSNDSRLNNLDAPISSRSTITPTDIWVYPSRTLTSFTLPPSEIDKIWGYLQSQATVPGSLGKKVADFLDATISSRATDAQVSALLSGVAQETTVQGLESTIQNENNENEILLNTIKNIINAIKAKTDNLPSDPSSESRVVSEIDDNESLINGLTLIANLIKAKTDNLPPDPAKEGSVQMIPTNPLLSNDARLLNLDAPISSRSDLDNVDLQPLAKTSELTNARNQIINEVNQNETTINSIQGTASSIKSKTDNLPTDPASNSNVDSAESSILSAIGNIPSGLSASDVWAHPTRTLSDPNTYKADVSNLPTKNELENAIGNQITVQMTTTYKNVTGEQEVLAWSEKNGLRLTGAQNCSVFVKDGSGTVVWSDSLNSPNSDGIFRFVQAVNLTTDTNYYVVVTIEAEPSNTVTGQKPFFTVG